MMTFRHQLMYRAAAMTLLPLLSDNAFAASPDARGFWLTENNKAIVNILLENNADVNHSNNVSLTKNVVMLFAFLFSLAMQRSRKSNN